MPSSANMLRTASNRSLLSCKVQSGSIVGNKNLSYYANIARRWLDKHHNLLSWVDFKATSTEDTWKVQVSIKIQDISILKKRVAYHA